MNIKVYEIIYDEAHKTGDNSLTLMNPKSERGPTIRWDAQMFRAIGPNGE